MALDSDEGGLLSQLEYGGYLMKTVRSAALDDAIRIIDSSGLTDVTYMTTVSETIVERMEKSGRMGPFLFALQLINVMMADARLDTET